MDTMAASRRDAAQLLDVHVDQLTGVGALIAADQLPSRPVHPGQPVQAMAAQHPRDGRGRQPNQRGDPSRAELAGLAQLQDLGLELEGGRRGWRWARLGRSTRPT